MPNYYKLLELNPTATLDEIKKAHRRLARLYHPDSNSAAGQDKSFHAIQEAYEVLSDSRRRKKYDLENGFANWTKEKLEEYKKKQEEADNFAREREEEYRMLKRSERQRKQTSFNQRSLREGETQKIQRETSSRTSNSIVSHWKEQMGLMVESLRKASGKHPPAETSGEDHFTHLTIDALQSLTGTTCQLNMGEGTAAKVFRIKVPPGVSQGAILKARGNNAADKDFRVRICVIITPHQYVRREGLDVILRVPVSVAEAVDGVEISIPTPDGSVKVQIPEKCTEGKKIRLKGKGVRDKKGTKGDLYIEPFIVLPEDMDTSGLEAARFLGRFYRKSIRAQLPKLF